MAHLELRNLGKSFSGKPAIRDVSLAVERGELVSLLGPSGCGKTTTLRIVAGFETPDSGEARLEDRDILQVPAHRRAMGVVFQSYALFPHLTAWGNVAFGMRMARRSTAAIGRRVPELLALVGLQDAGRSYPRQLSGGQQQRIALARALAIEPRMLLLDEPLSALDAVVRLALRDEIRSIQSTLGMTTLYVTHDQEEALAISDRVVVMRDGRIEQVGTAEAIYAQPATRFVAGFIGKMNQLPGRVEEPREGRVRCGAHRLQVPPQAVARLTAGAAVTILVRPEAVAVAADATAPRPGLNGMTARVEAVTFLGSIKRLGLDANGQRLMVDVSTAADGQFRRGDPVSVVFPIEACRVIVEEQAAAEGS